MSEVLTDIRIGAPACSKAAEVLEIVTLIWPSSVFASRRARTSPTMIHLNGERAMVPRVFSVRSSIRTLECRCPRSLP
jgi:hypothetical protein